MRPKIIVLDDDPTGSQTVHSCLLLLQWDVPTLLQALRDTAPIFFVLTNTRALAPEQAAAVTQQVCDNLKVAIDMIRSEAIATADMADFLVVSRSDSTLRGHYPIETDVIADTLGPFDAHFLVPAFLEGGRITRNSTHYLLIQGKPTPVHETEFARDSVFGYQHSYLPSYVEEKTQGRIPAESVECLLLDDLRQDCRERLQLLSNNVCVAVDAERQSDLDAFATAILATNHKRFLFRSAASLLTSLAQLPPQPIASEAMARYRRSAAPGAIVVGSHVRKSSEQLQLLLQQPEVVGIEVDIRHIEPVKAPVTVDTLNVAQHELAQTISAEVASVHAAGKTPVVYTSRQELTFPDAAARLAFGTVVSSILMAIIRALPADLSYLISKGGITSNDTLSQGLSLRTARLLGQILPGVSVVKTASDHPLFSDLPVVLFPGNVGEADALVTVFERLSKATPE